MKKLCEISDLDETQAYGADVDGVSYLVVLSSEDSQPRAYKNACPHLGIQLEMMPNEFLDPAREYIVCANHGALFQINDGLCIAGPCMNQKLQQLTIKVTDGGVYLDQ